MKESCSVPARPRLCFVGPMIGRNRGHLHTPGEILSDKFRERGYSVISVSSHSNRYRRLEHVVRTILFYRKEIDIMVLQVYGERSFVVEDIASWLGRLFGHRIVMFMHGGTLPRFFARFPNWMRRVLDRADALVAPSEFLARTVRNYGYPVQVIPNMLDVGGYPFRHRPAPRPKLFWMRAFHPWYNPFMAVRVLAELRSRLDHPALVMAGHDSGLEIQVQKLARQLGIEKAIRFSGFLDETQKIIEASAADVFLNTNHVDNMPVTILEACAMGLPVVATRVGGISDLLQDGETGLLVPDDDAEAMAKAVCRLIEEPGLAARLSTNGRRLAESCSSEQVYGRWERLFLDMLSGAPLRTQDVKIADHISSNVVD